VQGGVLKGLAGTDYEGMTLAYSRDADDAGAAAKNITITTTTGIAERLFQRLDSYIKDGTGLISEEAIRLTAQNERFVENIATLESRLAIFQSMLIQKYAAMERAVAQAEAIGDQLEAFLKAGQK
jgi:flagellar capping protein FliD